MNLSNTKTAGQEVFLVKICSGFTLEVISQSFDFITFSDGASTLSMDILVFDHENIFPYIQPDLSSLLFKATVPSIIPFILFATAAKEFISASSNTALSFNFARLKPVHLTQPPHVSHALQVPCSVHCGFCTVHPAQGKSTLLALWSAITLESCWVLAAHPVTLHHLHLLYARCRAWPFCLLSIMRLLQGKSINFPRSYQTEFLAFIMSVSPLNIIQKFVRFAFYVITQVPDEGTPVLIPCFVMEVIKTGRA